MEFQQSYFIKDGGNFRVQELDEDFNYVGEFTTNDEGKGVLNSPILLMLVRNLSQLLTEIIAGIKLIFMIDKRMSFFHS
ncbi:MAG: hypothetical protein AAGC64_12730 [Bacteroidota bacterium]